MALDCPVDVVLDIFEEGLAGVGGWGGETLKNVVDGGYCQGRHGGSVIGMTLTLTGTGQGRGGRGVSGIGDDGYRSCTWDRRLAFCVEASASRGCCYIIW